MTNWKPDIEGRTGPRYKAIASAIGDDVAAGVLAPGTRLPPHRELAWALGVTVGTVTRAYTEAMKRGLIEGEVGRGTYVRDREAEALRPRFGEPIGSNSVNLAMNFPPVGLFEEQVLRETLAEMSTSRHLGDLIGYKPSGGSWHHRQSFARWLETFGMPCDAERLLITGGAQNALAISLSAITEPGDMILAEEWTYPGLLSLANQLHLRVQSVALDHSGLIPEAFEKACRTWHPKAVYCQPTHQNPTTGTMAADRRRQIAEIARRYDVTIVEDDIYRFFSNDAPAPLSSHWPEGSIFITSVSKQLMPGLRIGMLVAGDRFLPRIEDAVRTMIWMSSPLMAEVAVRWLSDGTAERMVGEKRDEMAVRQDLLKDLLAGFEYRTTPGSLHAWMKLPELWRGEDAAAAALSAGITVTAGPAFSPQGEGRDFLRICIGAPTRRDDVQNGLASLAALLRTSPASRHSIM